MLPPLPPDCKALAELIEPPPPPPLGPYGISAPSSAVAAVFDLPPLAGLVR